MDLPNVLMSPSPGVPLSVDIRTVNLPGDDPRTRVVLGEVCIEGAPIFGRKVYVPAQADEAYVQGTAMAVTLAEFTAAMREVLRYDPEAARR